MFGDIWRNITVYLNNLDFVKTIIDEVHVFISHAADGVPASFEIDHQKRVFVGCQMTV